MEDQAKVASPQPAIALPCHIQKVIRPQSYAENNGQQHKPCLPLSMTTTSIDRTNNGVYLISFVDKDGTLWSRFIATPFISPTHPPTNNLTDAPTKIPTKPPTASPTLHHLSHPVFCCRFLQLQ